jgi:hypothetical protein
MRSELLVGAKVAPLVEEVQILVSQKRDARGPRRRDVAGLPSDFPDRVLLRDLGLPPERLHDARGRLLRSWTLSAAVREANAFGRKFRGRFAGTAPGSGGRRPGDQGVTTTIPVIMLP